jgi:extracellular factor (EF) 3-hydroxypalmitic acid methyl ester biosynthesis protein
MGSENGEFKESLIVCQTSQGLEIRATVSRLTRHLGVFEVYSPSLVLRTSEVLSEFRVVLRERVIYSGRAVVRGLVSTGLLTVCEVSLDESSWIDIEFAAEMVGNGKLREQFGSFIQDWQRLYQVTSEYKVIVADMQSYFTELRLWLDQVELGIRASPSGDRLRLEDEVTEELAKPIIPCVDALFEKFEGIAGTLAENLLPAHRNYMRRQLHPLMLCSPFAYRTYQKPLGYAGDYEMVNMILRNGYEGGSLYAKVVNTWFLRQPPAQAHRNRIAYLVNTLRTEVLRTRRAARGARILSVASGPAQEVQRFIDDDPLSDHARFTLLDFNEETLRYARATIDAIKTRQGRQCAVDYMRKSVQQILKESGRSIQRPDKQYDFVYCAGLFDYLTDSICRRLMDIMYEWVAPGGLLLATNVEPSNPLRNGMEHLLDWHLIYRNAEQMWSLAPSQVPADAVSVKSENTGVNLFLEGRKPEHA